MSPQPVLRCLTADITTLPVDVVVNAANPSLLGGGGVDGAIHRAAGPALLEECRAVVARRGRCEPGDAVITGAGALPARWVVHTVGPVWDGRAPEAHDRVLASCYRRSLDLSRGVGASSVAFPNISTGAYGFPADRAAAVAVSAVAAWVQRHRVSGEDDAPREILFVCFEAGNLELYEHLLG